MTTKRKRGCNYTALETNTLLDLVEQYKSVIEDKRTSNVCLAPKREAWEKICIAYNAVATSGIRTVEQLKVLYDNKKQRAKKSLAMHNGQWDKTGDGSCGPTAEDNNKKMLAMLQEQVTPLHNSCNSAAAYFGDQSDVVQIKEEPIVATSPPSSPDYLKNAQEFPEIQITTEPYIADQDGQSSQIMESQMEDELEYKKIPQHCKNGTPPRSKKRLVNYMQLYFKRKSQNALIQKRKLLLEIRLRQQEHQMFLKEHKLKLELMQKEHDAKMKEYSNSTRI